MILDDCDALHYRQEVLCRRCRAGEGEKKKKKVVSVFHGGRLVAPPCLCKDMKNRKLGKKIVGWITYFPLQAKYVKQNMFTHISGLRKYTSSTNKQWQRTNASKLHSNQSWKNTAIFHCIHRIRSNFQHTNYLFPFIKNMLITMPQWLRFPPHEWCYALPSCGLLLLWTCFHIWDILTWNEEYQPEFNSFVNENETYFFPSWILSVWILRS